jgi:hypothetical protein
MWVRYDSGPFVPTAHDRALTDSLNAHIASLGDVVMPSHSFMPIRNGSATPQIHEQGYIDVMGAALADWDVVQCFSAVRGRHLVLDNASQAHFVALVEMGYQLDGPMPESTQVVTGQHTAPNRLLARTPDAAIFVPRHRARVLFDFEERHYPQWGRDGNAFEHGTTLAISAVQTPIGGQRGRRLASSFSPVHFDGAVGRMRSPPFTIDRSHLGFRVGGGTSEALRVELRVDNRVVRELRGAGRDFEMVAPVIWDVRDLEGQSANLWLIDHEGGGWGHLMVDAVELFDDAPGAR